MYTESEMKKLEFLAGRGFEVEKTLERFVDNFALYYKYLLKFPEGNTFDALTESLKSCDGEGILNNVHTLKGVSANLGMTALFEASSALVVAMRENREKEANALYRKIAEEYQKVISTLKELGELE